MLGDGTVSGFVGGTCAESTVRAQGLALLDSGESLLLRISPTEEAAQPGKLTVVNPCLSGGTLEIFLEPVMPPPLVAVHGDTPIARALAALAVPLGYGVTPWEGADPTDAAAVVVASHGRDEEAVLEAALRAGVPYVGLVASRKRGEAVVSGLAADEAEPGPGADTRRPRPRRPHARGDRAVDPGRDRGRPTSPVRAGAVGRGRRGRGR